MLVIMYFSLSIVGGAQLYILKELSDRTKNCKQLDITFLPEQIQEEVYGYYPEKRPM